MRHGFAIYFLSRISSLSGNRPIRGLDKISAKGDFSGFCGSEDTPRMTGGEGHSSRLLASLYKKRKDGPAPTSKIGRTQQIASRRPRAATCGRSAQASDMR